MRNGAATILATLASVASQTLRPSRIIVVDDGSDDDGDALIRNLPLVEVISTTTRGVSGARNTGIQASSAPFVAFLDCDDLWRPDKLERQLKVFSDRPDISVVSCDHICIRPDGMAVPSTKYTPRFRGRVFDEILESNFDLGGWSSSMIVRRDSLMDIGGYDESLQFGEDMDICIRLAQHNSFDYCPDVLTFVVNNPASTMRRPSEDRRNLEVSLQYLSVIEKWIGTVAVSNRVTGRCLQYILSRYARRRLGCDLLVEFRTALAKRNPKLAHRIARSRAHFAAKLMLCAILRSPKIVAAVVRQIKQAWSVA